MKFIVIVCSILVGTFAVCMAAVEEMNFRIKTTWDNHPVDHKPVEIKLSSDLTNNELVMEINAPFFNDPPAPSGERGQPFPKLWDYEVVEAFFLGKEEKYLEVEFSPHGQHLLLFLSGPGQAIKQCLPVTYDATINGDTWYGIARIKADYFPPGINLFNAFAIHGSGDRRTYESLYPAQTGYFETPNFHRLELFKYIEFFKLVPSNPSSGFSNVWEESLKNKDNQLTC